MSKVEGREAIYKNNIYAEVSATLCSCCRKNVHFWKGITRNRDRSSFHHTLPRINYYKNEMQLNAVRIGITTNLTIYTVSFIENIWSVR